MLRRFDAAVLWAAMALADAALVQLFASLFLAVGAGKDGWQAGVTPLPALLAVYGAAGLTERTAAARGMSARTAGALRTGLGLAAGLLAAAWSGWRLGTGLTPELAVSVGLGAAYAWRAGAAAGTGAHLADGFTPRATALAAMTALGVIFLNDRTARPDLEGDLYRVVAVFFSGALAGLALSRLREVRRRQGAMGEAAEAAQVSPFLYGVSAALVGAALLTDRAGLGPLLLGALNWVYAGVAGVLGAIGALLGPGIERLAPLLWPLEQVLRWLKTLRKPEIQEMLDFLFGTARAAEPVAPYLLRDHAGALKVLGFTLAALLAVWLLWGRRERRDARAAGAGAPDEERESLGVWCSLQADLLALWARLLAWLRPQPAGAPAVVGTGPAEALPSPAVRDVRAAFRRLQELGARQGRPRRRWETPLAYAAALGARLPGLAQAAGALAELYSRTRYGRTGATAADAAAAAALVAAAEAGAASTTR